MENKILPQGLEVPNRQTQIHLMKSMVLAGLAVLSFALTWQLLLSGFAHGDNLGYWVIPSLIAAIAITFLALFNVVNRIKWLFWLTSLLIPAIYVLIMPKTWAMLISGVVFFVLSFWFEQRIKHDETARTDFSLSRVMRGSITIMVYALLFVIAMNVYAKAQTSFKNDPQHFYGQIGRYAAEGLQYVPSGLGDFSPNQRFNDFVSATAARQDPAFAQATPSQKELLAEEVKQGLEDRFNLRVTGNPVLGDVVAGWVTEKVQHAATNYQNLFPAIFAVIVAVLLRWVAFVFIWLTLLVSWLIFKLLMLLKFFRIEKVQVEVDKLQI